MKKAPGDGAFFRANVHEAATRGFKTSGITTLSSRADALWRDRDPGSSTSEGAHPMNGSRWKVSTETLLDLVQTAAIVTGIVFGLRELGELQKSRELDTTLKLVDVIQNEATGVGVRRLFTLPANLPEEEFQRQLGDDLDNVMLLAATFESLGIMVYRREASLDLVDEMFGGVVGTAWDRVKPFISSERQRIGNPQMFEWFQWLAERLQEHRAKPGTAPAYVQHRDWKP